MKIKLIEVIKHPLIRDMAVYTSGDLLSKAVPFVLLPIVAYHITPEKFGLLTNYGVVIQILSAICALNTYTTITIFYNQIQKSQLPEYLSNLFYLIIGLGLFCLPILWFCGGWVTARMGVELNWLYMALIAAVSTSIVNLYASLLRIQNKALEFNVFQVSQSFFAGFVAILLVVWIKLGWEGRAISLVLAPLLVSLVVLIKLKKTGVLFSRFKINRVREFFYFGLPLLPHTLSFWLKSGVDKIIISIHAGMAENGIYSIALTMAALVGVFTGSFFNAYAPNFYANLALIDSSDSICKKEIKIKLVKNAYRFMAVLFLVSVLSYFVLAITIPFMFKEEYSGAIRYIPVILVTLFFDGMYSIASGFLFFRKKTKLLGSITFSTSLLQIGLTICLVKNMGAMGAAVSSAIVSAITFVAVMFCSDRLYQLPWRPKSVMQAK